VLSSLSLYELAKRFWQQEEYERALVAVEQSIALKLFPYADAGLLERWQRSLVAQVRLPRVAVLLFTHV
jgi:hypothetical protein